MAFLKVRPKKGKRSFKNENNEGYVDDRLLKATLADGFKTSVFEDPSFNKTIEHYLAEDLEIISCN